MSEVDKMVNSTIMRPVLHVTGMPNFMFILQKALDIAKQHGMDCETIRSEVLMADAAKKREVLAKYFEVI